MYSVTNEMHNHFQVLTMSHFGEMTFKLCSFTF